MQGAEFYYISINYLVALVKKMAGSISTYLVVGVVTEVCARP